MKYTVSINEEKRAVTVTLEDGTKGVARCCPTDRFDINTGIELALERAKVAKANAEKEKATTEPKPKSVMELVHELEKALPEGEMVVVGNGKEMTAEQKKWLVFLAGVPAKCHCHCDCHCGDSDEDGDYESGYDDGYNDGYADAEAEYADESDNETALNRIREILEDVGII
jgi:hypothetical protein